MEPDIALSIGFTDQQGAQRVLSGLKSQIQGFSASGTSALGGLTKALGAVGLAVGAFAAVKQVVTQAIGAFQDFEDASLSLQAITGATAEEVRKYGDAAKEFAADNLLSTAAADALKAFELVGSAKPELLKTQDALIEVTKSAIVLQKAAGGPLEQSVKDLTDAMNQFGLSASQADRTINVLAAGSKEGAAPIGLITQALLKFGTTAKASNISLEESVAGIEVFAEKGLKGADAGTAFRNVLTKIAAVDALPPEAIKRLTAAGVNFDILKDKTIPLADRLQEMGKISGSTADLVKVFGEENQNAARIILTNTTRLRELTEAVKGTETAYDQAATKTQSLSTVFQNFQNQIGVALIELGQQLAPFVRAFLDGFVKAFQTFKPIALGLITTLFDFGKAIGGLIGDLFGAGEAGDGFDTILQALKFSFLAITKPTQLIIQGITFLINGYRDVRNAVEGFLEKLGPLGDALRVLINPIGAVRDAIGTLVDGFNSLFGATEEAALGFDDGIKALGGITGALSAVARETGATKAELKGFIPELKSADFAGLSLAEKVALLKKKFEEYKDGLPPTIEATKKTGEQWKFAAGSAGRLGEQLTKLNEAFQAATTTGERFKLLGDIDKVNAEIKQINTELTDLVKKRVSIPVEIASRKPDLEPLTEAVNAQVIRVPVEPTISLNDLQRQLADFNAAFAAATTDAERIDISAKITGVEESIARIEALRNSLTFLQETTNAVKDALIAGFTDIAFSIGEAIAGAATAMDVFKQVLNLLLVQVPKMIGIAMINQAAAVPSPASLPLAIAGAALIGLSGLFSGIINKNREEDQLGQVAQSQINGRGATTAGQVAGLSAFSGQQSTNNINVVVNLDGQTLQNAAANVFENGQEVRGRR